MNDPSLESFLMAFRNYESVVLDPETMNFPDEEARLVWTAARAVAETAPRYSSGPLGTLDYLSENLQNFSAPEGRRDLSNLQSFMETTTRYLGLAVTKDVPNSNKSHADATSAFLSLVNLRLRETRTVLNKLEKDADIAERLSLVLASSVLENHYQKRADEEAKRADWFRGLGWALLLIGVATTAVLLLSTLGKSFDASSAVAKLGISALIFSLPVVAFRTEALHRNDSREYREASLALATLPAFANSLPNSDVSSTLIASVGTQALRRNSYSTTSATPGPGTDPAGLTSLIALLIQTLGSKDR